jgi:hypothetical protein
VHIVGEVLAGLSHVRLCSWGCYLHPCLWPYHSSNRHCSSHGHISLDGAAVVYSVSMSIVELRSWVILQIGVGLLTPYQITYICLSCPSSDCESIPYIVRRCLCLTHLVRDVTWMIRLSWGNSPVIKSSLLIPSQILRISVGVCHIILLSRLGANPSKSPNPRTAFIWIILSITRITSICILVATLNIYNWVLWSWWSLWSVRLTELVQDRPRSFRVNSWNLRHYLAVVGMRVISEFRVGRLVLWRTGFVWTICIFVPVSVVASLSRRQYVVHCATEHTGLTVLLIIIHPRLLEQIDQTVDSFLVTCVESISSELLNLALGDLLGLFDLLRVELDLVRIDSSPSNHTQVTCI